LTTSSPTTAEKECDGTPAEIPYKNNLTWKDFKGEAPTKPKHNKAALTVSGFRYDVKISWGPEVKKGKWTGFIIATPIATPVENTLKVSSYMDRCASWVKETEKSAALLKHEQGHFDISEYWARQAKAALQTAFDGGLTGRAKPKEKKGSEGDFATANLEKKMDAIYDAEFKKMDKMQDDYDKETKNGTDETQQAAWNIKIANLLSGENG
jgi:hypothetical protein